MSTAPRKHSGSEREQAIECLNAIVWQLQMAYMKTGACDCSGREEIGLALEVALQTRATLATSEEESDYSEVLSVICYLFDLAVKVTELISSLSNDYQFPEDYEDRVNYTKAA